MNSADTADQMTKMTLEGIQVAAEVSLKAGASAARSLAVMLYAIIKDKKKVKGKTRLDNLLKSGKELKVFAIHHSDLEKFCTQAKNYGVLYSVLKEKNNTDGIVDIMVRAEDASKITRMVDKYDLATISTKLMKDMVLSDKETKPMSEEEHDALVKQLLDDDKDPSKARQKKDGLLSEQSSKTSKKENKQRQNNLEEPMLSSGRPSVKKELEGIKKSRIDKAFPGKSKTKQKER